LAFAFLQNCLQVNIENGQRQLRMPLHLLMLLAVQLHNLKRWLATHIIAYNVCK